MGERTVSVDSILIACIVTVTAYPSIESQHSAVTTISEGRSHAGIT